MRYWKMFFFLAAPLLFCACLEVKQEIVVNKDGGGKITETVMISKAMLKQLNDIFPGLGSQKIDIYDKKKLEADAVNYGPGAKYSSSKRVSTKIKDGYEVVYTFNDINKLKINQNPGDKGPKMSKDEKSEAKVENITFNFEKGEPATLTVNLPLSVKPPKEEKQKTGKKDKVAEQKEIEEAAQIFKDLYIGITIQMEGEIAETNATYRDGNKITLLEMDFGKLLENAKQFESFAKKKPETIEEAKALLKNLPGFKVELNQKVVVKSI